MHNEDSGDDSRDRRSQGAVARTGETTENQVPSLSGADEGQKDEVDIAINGNKGPTIRFRIGVLAIINGIILLVGFGATFSLLRADVDDLKVEGKSQSAQVQEVIRKLSAIETGQDYIREEVRFLRDELATSDALTKKRERVRDTQERKAWEKGWLR